MSQLNIQWMITVMQQAIDARDQGTNIFVSDFPEIADLAARGFLIINKRKKDADGNWYATAAENLTNDVVTAALTSAAPAPAPAPVPVPAPVDTLAQTAVPQFDAAQAPAAPPVAAEGEVAIGGGTPRQVLETFANADGDQFELEVGVAFVKRSNIAGLNAARQPRAEKYPFSKIADLKRDNIGNDAFVPSFHIANKESKNISGMVTRNNEVYEKSHGVTFRAQQVGAEDPKGAGVRVFAMSIAQAPARKRANKKEAAPSAETLVDSGAQTVAQVPTIPAV